MKAPLPFSLFFVLCTAANANDEICRNHVEDAANGQPPARVERRRPSTVLPETDERSGEEGQRGFYEHTIERGDSFSSGESRGTSDGGSRGNIDY